ncbi:hypothetical protein SAMN05216480_10741 [Pustulibacterium marinum]|uniref:Uncharacterized protein n=1 Tax=Pustulibacterium marinum TaxID=1224947 RepID=A0A1I7H486_9FLAO|nr:hypothetical protein [Pustulibacterium marinum]SFU55527.1 hypothetical protein SAMN05216480_10741 [Pustulibacterium marinum]
MQKTYSGTYWYTGAVPKDLKNVRTNFQLELEATNDLKFTGTVEDDVTTGGTPGIGNIEGEWKKNTIVFVKQMPVFTHFNSDGSMVTGRPPHQPIYYKGNVDTVTGNIRGTWKVKFSVSFSKGRLWILPSVKGEWEMRQHTE